VRKSLRIWDNQCSAVEVKIKLNNRFFYSYFCSVLVNGQITGPSAECVPSGNATGIFGTAITSPAAAYAWPGAKRAFHFYQPATV